MYMYTLRCWRKITRHVCRATAPQITGRGALYLQAGFTWYSTTTHTNSLAIKQTYTLKTREYRILRAQAVAFQRY